MESVLKNFNITTRSTADMYTLDHRGTGRSSVLACQAAQAFSDGSPGGVESRSTRCRTASVISLSRSRTRPRRSRSRAPAKDLVYLIDLLNGKGAEVYVYGASYGTYWGSRVMHLAPPQIKAYILDGVVDEKVASLTTWNENHRPSGTREATVVCQSIDVQ